MEENYFHPDLLRSADDWVEALLRNIVFSLVFKNPICPLFSEIDYDANQ